MFNLKSIKKLNQLINKKSKKTYRFNIPTYLILFLFLPAISCQQAPRTNGLPLPPFDYIFTIGNFFYYLLYLLILVILSIFSVFPDAKYFKFQTCCLIGINNFFFSIHSLEVVHLSHITWLLLLISISVGIGTGLLSLSNKTIREFTILIPSGYIAGYWFTRLFGIDNRIICLCIIGGLIASSFSLKFILSSDILIRLCRGICLGFLILVTLDICIPIFVIFKSIHGIGWGIIPFFSLIFSIVWAGLELATIYYEFNRASVVAKINNRNLTPQEKADGLGTNVDEKKKAVEPSASMV